MATPCKKPQQVKYLMDEINSLCPYPMSTYSYLLFSLIIHSYCESKALKLILYLESSKNNNIHMN